MQSQPQSYLTISAAELIALLQAPKTKPSWTRELKARALELKKSGLPDKVTAKRLGVSLGSLKFQLYKDRKARKSDFERSKIFWTQARIVALIFHWNQGKSASAVAFELGGGNRPGFPKEQHPSRSAVIGKVRRLRKQGIVLRAAPHLGVSRRRK